MTEGARDTNTERQSDTAVQIKVRMRPDDHAWLVEEARRHGVTLNAIIVWRVLQGREHESLYKLSEIVEKAARWLEPLHMEELERRLYADCLNSAREIIDIVQPLLDAIDDRSVTRIRRSIDGFNRAFSNLTAEVGDKVTTRGVFR